MLPGRASPIFAYLMRVGAFTPPPESAAAPLTEGHNPLDATRDGSRAL
jgi:hypothetical protein